MDKKNEYRDEFIRWLESRLDLLDGKVEHQREAIAYEASHEPCNDAMLIKMASEAKVTCALAAQMEAVIDHAKAYLYYGEETD